MSTGDDVKDARIDVSLNGVALGSFAVDNTIGTDVYDDYGTASVSVKLPKNLTYGSAAQLTLTGAQTGTSVVVPITIDKADSTTVGLPNKLIVTGNGTLQFTTIVVAQRLTRVTGEVTIYDGGTAIATATLTDRSLGIVKVTLPKLGKGVHKLSVTYGGSDTVNPSTSPKVTILVK